MSPASLSAAAAFAVLLVTALVAHDVLDHWGQTPHQSEHKARPGLVGHWNCFKHVAVYSIGCLAAMLAAAAACGFAADLSVPGLVAATLLNAVTHYVADRRGPLRWLAVAVFRKRQFCALGVPRDGRDDNPCLGTGLYALDQSFHRWFHLVAVAVIVAASFG